MTLVKYIKKPVFLFIAVIYTAICMAQSSFSVAGSVFDNRHRPVVSAGIHLHSRHDDVRTTSKEDGSFEIKCICGRDYKLTISCVGFKDEIYTIKDLRADIRLDSIILEESITGLEETVITPKTVRITYDRRILYPTENQRKNSADGISLLSMMKLPRTTIIPGTSEVRYWGKGNLRYYINDTKATVSQIRALVPGDILRVEYIDTPGLEYQEQEDVGLVIRIITRSGIRGMYNSIVIDKQVNRNAGAMNIESRTTGKSSEFAVSYSGYMNNSTHHFNPEFTDETFHTPEGVVRRLEETTGMTSYEHCHDLSLAFFKTRPDKDYLYIKTELKLNRLPDNISNSTVRNFGLRNDISHKQTDTSAKDNTFTANIFYRKTIDKKQMLLFDATYYLMKADAYRYSMEMSGDKTAADILSDACATSQGGSFTGMYRNIMSDRWMLQTSASSYLDIAESIYNGNYNGISRMTRSISTLSSRISYRKERLDASLTMILALNHTRVADKYKSTGVEPKVSLNTRYLFNGRCYVGGSLGYVPIRPQTNDLSTARQQIDEYQIRCGNPELERGHAIGLDIDGNIGIGIFDINPYISYERTYNNIQEETFIKNGMTVRMPNNFDYVNALKSGIEISAEPLEWLTMAVSAGYNRFSSKSGPTGFKQNYGKMWFRANINARYNGWVMSYNIWTHNNDFYGQVLETSSRSMSFSLQRIWLGGRMSASLRIQNPFSKSFSWQDVVNYSPVAPYNNRTRSDYSFRMLTLSVAYKFSSGRKTKGNSIKTGMTPQNYIISSRKSAEVKQY